MRYVFFDVETSGKDPLLYPFIQWAGIAVDENWNEVDQFEVKARLTADDVAEEQALKINHYDPEVWQRDGVDRKQAIEQVAEFLRNNAAMHIWSKSQQTYLDLSRVVGYNIGSFDLPNMYWQFKQAGIDFPAHFHYLDTHELAKWHLLGAKNRPVSMALASVLYFLEHGRDGSWEEINQAYSNQHDALEDVRMTIRVTYLLVQAMKLDIWNMFPDKRRQG